MHPTAIRPYTFLVKIRVGVGLVMYKVIRAPSVSPIRKNIICYEPEDNIKAGRVVPSQLQRAPGTQTQS